MDVIDTVRFHCSLMKQVAEVKPSNSMEVWRGDCWSCVLSSGAGRRSTGPIHDARLKGLCCQNSSGRSCLSSSRINNNQQGGDINKAASGSKWQRTSAPRNQHGEAISHPAVSGEVGQSRATRPDSDNGGQHEEEVGGTYGFKSVVHRRHGQSRALHGPWSYSVRRMTAAAEGTEEGGLGPRGSCMRRTESSLKGQ